MELNNPKWCGAMAKRKTSIMIKQDISLHSSNLCTQVRTVWENSRRHESSNYGHKILTVGTTDMCWESMRDWKTVMDRLQIFRRERLQRPGRGAALCAKRQLRSQNHRITESQNGRGWKGPLWDI